MQYVRTFNTLGINDIELVGGKNASLGEMITELSPLGIRIPDGFATTADAYWSFLDHNGLRILGRGGYHAVSGSGYSTRP